MAHFLNSRITIVVAVLLLTVFLYGFVRTYLRDHVVEQEIKILEKKQEQLEGQRTELVKLLKKVQTTAYLEEQAREQLGLRKPGEKSVLFRESETQATSTPASNLNSGEYISNAQKWWNYFFANRIK